MGTQTAAFGADDAPYAGQKLGFQLLAVYLMALNCEASQQQGLGTGHTSSTRAECAY